MTVPSFTMRQLLEAGVHFGHQTHRWNPKVDQYLFGVRNGIHIIDLQQTVPMLYRALEFVQKTVSGGGRVLFVGTKRQAQEPVAEAAKRCGQYFVNHRWLGGILTNWRTISNSIGRLRTLDDQLGGDSSGLTKKELLNLTRERDRLERTLGGIREMGGLPDVVFIIDTNKEKIAKLEAIKLGIPVMAVIDSNSDPDGVTYPIPGNDDATRAILLYCQLLSQAVIDGLQAEQVALGGDIGASDKAPAEVLPETVKEVAPIAAAEAAAEPAAEAAAEPAAEAAAEPAAEAAAEPAAEAAAEPAAEAAAEPAAEAAAEPAAEAAAEPAADAPAEPAAGAVAEPAAEAAAEPAAEAAAEPAAEAAAEPAAETAAEAAAEPAAETAAEPAAEAAAEPAAEAAAEPAAEAPAEPAAEAAAEPAAEAPAEPAAEAAAEPAEEVKKESK